MLRSKKHHNKATKPLQRTKTQKIHTKTVKPSIKKSKILSGTVSRHVRFSTDSTTQQIPVIPELDYIQYDNTTDVVALLKSRGFINQTTSTLGAHFSTSTDLNAHSTADALQSISSGQSVDIYNDGSYTGKPYRRPLDRPIEPRCIYAGFDPTASSLHLGNLLVIVALMHFYKSGHKVVALTGGATGMVGDPSGRSSERVLQSEEQVRSNAKSISETLKHFFTSQHDLSQRKHKKNTMTSTDTQHNLIQPVFVDNLDWYKNMSIVDFLRDVGKFFRISTMLSKDSVKSRMDSNDGLSLTEFTYQALQGYDFHHLRQHHGVSVQIGGSDQWGNITAGIDLINKYSNATHDTQQSNDAAANTTPGNTIASAAAAAATTTTSLAHGLTLPLLTTSAGVKFGKSMGNAVWLSSTMTSPFHLYQYLLSTADADCRRFLLTFTFLTEDAIDNIMTQHNILPDVRIAQRVLACELVYMIHGKIGLQQALVTTSFLFTDKFDVDVSQYISSSSSTTVDDMSTSDDTTNANETSLYKGLTMDQFLQCLQGVPITTIPPLPAENDASQVLALHEHPHSFANLAVSSGLCASKGDVKRLMKNNGYSVAGVKIKEDGIIDKTQLPFGKIALLRSGQKKVNLVILQ